MGRWDGSGFPGGSVVKNPPAMQERWRHGFNHWVKKIPWRRKGQLAPVFLLGKFRGQRSLAGYSPWPVKALGTAEHAHTAGGCIRGSLHLDAVPGGLAELEGPVLRQVSICLLGKHLVPVIKGRLVWEEGSHTIA